MEMLISFSSRTWHLPTLPKVPKAGSMTMMLLCLIGQQTLQTWTCIVERKMRDTRPNNADDRTTKQPGLPLTWAVPQADCLHATPHWCSKSCKKAQPSIECIEMNILFRSLIFLFKISFFYLPYVIFKFSKTLNFGFSLSVSHNHQNLIK